MDDDQQVTTVEDIQRVVGIEADRTPRADTSHGVPVPRPPLPPPAAAPLLQALGAILGALLLSQVALLGLGADPGSVLAGWWAGVRDALLIAPLVDTPATVTSGEAWILPAVAGHVLTVWAAALTGLALVASRTLRAGVVTGTAVLVATGLVVAGAVPRFAVVLLNVELHATLGQSLLHLAATVVLPLIAIDRLRRSLAPRRRLPTVSLGG